MGILDSISADDAAFAFTDTDAFAETVTLTPRSGTTRSVKAVVNRQGLASRVELAQGIAAVIIVELRDDSTYGLARSEWDNGIRITITNPSPGRTSHTFVLPPWDQAGGGMLTFRINRD